VVIETLILSNDPFLRKLRQLWDSPTARILGSTLNFHFIQVIHIKSIGHQGLLDFGDLCFSMNRVVDQSNNQFPLLDGPNPDRVPNVEH
jgi:hypothetical protein